MSRLNDETQRTVLRDYRVDRVLARGEVYITSATVVMVNGRPENEFVLRYDKHAGAYLTLRPEAQR